MKSVLLIRDPQTEFENRLWTKYQDASKRVADPKSGADGARAYTIAYQDLVKSGLVQQIKRKYR